MHTLCLVTVGLCLISSTAWSTCRCSCDEQTNQGSIERFAHVVPGPTECQSACSFDEQVSGYTLSAVCQNNPPPPPPPQPIDCKIQVDWCVDPSIGRPNPFDKGNDVPMQDHQGGTSCIKGIPLTVKRYRVWCHVYIEGDPSQDGFCSGMGPFRLFPI